MTDALSKTFLALADPTRRAILVQIADGALTVTALVEANHLSQPGISRHLKVLEDAGLIRRERMAKTRPVNPQPDGLKHAAGWIDHSRKNWEGTFDRMDAPIARLHEETERNGRHWCRHAAAYSSLGRPPGLVWAIWTRPELIRSWFAVSHGFRAHDIAVDLRPGGSWRFDMERDGQPHRIHGSYHEIVQDKRLAFYPASPSSMFIPSFRSALRPRGRAGGCTSF